MRSNEVQFTVAELIAFMSQDTTLLPGTIIFTGTPGTTQAMEPGDVVEVELEGVGVLRNTVAQGREVPR